MRVLVTLLLVLAIAGGGGYWYWIRTPQYSLEQVKAAIKAHDLEKFNKYVDVDGTSTRMVDDFFTKPMRDALGPSILGQVLVTGLASFLRPQIARGIKHEILTFVETGQFRPENSADQDPPPGGISLSGMDLHLGFRAHALKSVTSVQTDGDLAQLELLLHNTLYNEDLPLDVKMRKMDGYWQIIELTNFPSFCGKLAALEAQHQTGGDNAEQPAKTNGI